MTKGEIHVLRVESEFMITNIDNYFSAPDASVIITDTLMQADGELLITDQKCEIGKNGLRLMFGSNNILEFINSEFVIRTGQYGIQVTASGIKRIDPTHSN